MKKEKLAALVIGLFLATTLKSQIAFNNGFENWSNNLPVNWIGSQTTVSNDSIMLISNNAHSGSKACRLICRSSNPREFSTRGFSLISGKTYFVSYWVKGCGNISSVNVVCGSATSVPGLNHMIDSSVWVHRSGQFIATSTNNNAELVFTLSMTLAAKGDVQFDDVLIYTSETFQDLDTNGISARINSDGSLFTSHFEVPKGSGINSISESNLWIAGKNNNGSLLLSAQTYSSIGTDFFFGPVGNNYYDTNYILRYNRVWKVNSSVIDYHQAHYHDSGYMVPASIADWPGNGNTLNGEMDRLAPFVDVNLNNYYDPENGDYPLIRGDQAVFFMFNDDKEPHSLGGMKLKLEVHGMAYSYTNSLNDDLNNTVFINYKIYNRSTINYNEVYLACFTDLDLGYPFDDYTGYDSTLSMLYTYNSTNTDGSGTPGTYGTPPPAQGMIALNQTVTGFMSNSNDTSTLPWNPSLNWEYYNYLRGLWRDNSQITAGGTGHGGVTPTNFMFTGMPENGTGWTEINSGTLPGDKKGIVRYGPISIRVNETLCLDIAYPFAQDNAGNNLSSVAMLRKRAESVIGFFNNNGFQCFEPNEGINNLEGNETKFAVTPNPNNGKFSISSSSNFHDLTIEIYSVLGDLIYSQKINSNYADINLNVNKGFYLYAIKENNKLIGKGKIVID